jgi:uncharacterized membrane protein (UPF0127 family)
MNRHFYSPEKFLILTAKTVIACSVFGAFLLTVPIYHQVRSYLTSAIYHKLVISKTVVEVNIADSPRERKTGLSGKKELEYGQGLLFIFNNEGRHSIWMKDMKFSIDVIWFDRYLRVIHFVENLSPDTYPKSYQPPTNAVYVLEVPAGFVQKNGVLLGDIATLF